MVHKEIMDIRWIQRFANYRNALARLTMAVKVISGRDCTKVMKDFAEYQGYTEIRGSRDAFRIALQMGLIEDSAWMDSIADRNLTSHNYDEDVAEEVYQSVVEKYHPLFLDFEKNMLSLLPLT